jgi:Flp pilus assembly protein TadD
VGAPDAAPEADPAPGSEPVDETGVDAPAVAESDQRLASAKAAVAEGRVAEALELYSDILTDDPGHVKALNNLGVLYDALGRHQAAVEQFQAAQRLEPESVEVLTNLGAGLGAVGRFDEAEATLRRAQRLAPNSAEVRASLGMVYFHRGLYAEAETELKWACASDEEHGQAHYYRGEALNRMGRYDDAFEVLQRAAELLPDDPRVFYTLGRLCDRRHEPAEAAAMYRRARALQER